MEGAGSRLGRSSSRYGTTTVFSGPVRRWEKRWVQVASSSLTYSQSNANNGSRLLLRRWTPITQSNSCDRENTSGDAEERPRRKFRYTPVALLEERKERAKTVDDATNSETSQPTKVSTLISNSLYDKPDMNVVLVEETQASNKDRLSLHDTTMSQLDLGLCLKRDEDGIGT